MPNLRGASPVLTKETVQTRHERSAEASQIGGVVDPVEPSTRGGAIRGASGTRVETRSSGRRCTGRRQLGRTSVGAGGDGGSGRGPKRM